MTVWRARGKRLADLDEILRRCPFPVKASCATIDEATDLFLVIDQRNRSVFHRHDHRRCIETTGRYALHPEDLNGPHVEPDLYRFARRPLQARWRAPWQVLTSSLLSSRTSPKQALRASSGLYRAAVEPADLLTVDLVELLRPIGLRLIPHLREIGRRWPDVTPAPEDVDRWPGVGYYASEAYRLFVFGIRPQAWISPLLALADSMGRVDGFIAQAPERR